MWSLWRKTHLDVIFVARKKQINYLIYNVSGFCRRFQYRSSLNFRPLSRQQFILVLGQHVLRWYQEPRSHLDFREFTIVHYALKTLAKISKPHLIPLSYLTLAILRKKYPISTNNCPKTKKIHRTRKRKQRCEPDGFSLAFLQQRRQYVVNKTPASQYHLGAKKLHQYSMLGNDYPLKVQHIY